jgi:hypothetical protein
MREAVSSWWIFLSSPSLRGPGFSFAICASSLAFSAAIFSSNVWGIDCPARHQRLGQGRRRGTNRTRIKRGPGKSGTSGNGGTF